MRVLPVCALLLAAFAGAARAQTMLDQEERLIEIASLLIAVPPDNAPGAYRPGQLALGMEIVGIPAINGQTGGKTQITPRDKTPLFPRLRLAYGLPAPNDFRSFVGLAYIPPIPINDVQSHLGALEAGFAWTPDSPFTAGIRATVLLATSKSPVTDANTKDTLDDFEYGGDVSAGYRFDLGRTRLTPFASVGVTRVNADFTVTSDGYTLTSDTTNLGLTGGLRLGYGRIEGLAEVVVWPGRLVHPTFSVAWLF
ncbi:MAG: autotransporter domain-containing protein [Myxococcales bacterium]